MLLILGAGIAGISLAYHLAVRRGLRNILLLDCRPPLSLTSDKSTEAYRNWWPGPDGAMIGLMNRSIDLLEEVARESKERFHLNRRGYLFVTARRERVAQWREAAARAARMGAGALRLHHTPASDYRPAPPEGWRGQPSGADLLTDPALLRRHYPYLNARAVAALHVRRAGWLSAQQLGMYLLEEARAAGVELLRDEALRLAHSQAGGRQRLEVHLRRGGPLFPERLVLAPGPFLGPLAAQLGVDLPLTPEPHLKIAFDDRLEAVPREAPLLIWSDPQQPDWTPEERAFLEEEEDTRPLKGLLPSGVHTRPEGGADSRSVVALWEYHAALGLSLAPPGAPLFPLPTDDLYPEVVLRGLEALLPAVRGYRARLPRPQVDGGYYLKTPENRPLIGPLPVEGVFALGALSGYGIMASQGAADLLAAHLTGEPLPAYAAAFHPRRYEDPAYRRRLASWRETWQL